MNKKETSLAVFSRIFDITGSVAPGHKLQLLSAYTRLLQADATYHEVKKALNYFREEGVIPLVTVKSLSQKLDGIISSLGSITLAVEPRIDETALLPGISEALDLREPERIKQLEKHIHGLITRIENTCKDKHFLSYLDYLKEKSWSLLEALDTYGKDKYKQSVFKP